MSFLHLSDSHLQAQRTSSRLDFYPSRRLAIRMAYCKPLQYTVLYKILPYTVPYKIWHDSCLLKSYPQLYIYTSL
ncbi:hypothetical protein FDJ20_gp110 [Vibrio phage Thalassa]|uniref:Uncharacterized protein n=1 Tax=Vibrio phage Thalassa TaxID=2570301 RepID=A0A2H5BHB8_9CAUD|nr:hypothetical protein FDJ20_gp110 [Vibrio phage Thalassa]AUG85392.1 hypothetical protein THALASSA_213 [Vibrio phage Thalassa]